MKYILLFVLSALSSCAQMFPAVSKKISPGVYHVSAHGNVFAKKETLNNKIEKKATKLCGEKRYVVTEDHGVEVREQKTYNNGVAQYQSYIVLEKTIKCDAD